MLYCRPISDFSLFDEFKPGEFKIIDFMREHLKPSEKFNTDFVESFRLLHALKEDYSGLCLFFESLIFDNEKNKYQFWDIFCEIGDNETTKIHQILLDRNFIRNDNYLQSCLISGMVIGEDYKTPTREIGCSALDWLLDMVNWGTYYETLKPTADEELSRIFDVLRDKLSPAQFAIMRFYILNADIFDYYEYTPDEILLIRTALRNIRDPHFGIASMINEIMDNTLF